MHLSKIGFGGSCHWCTEAIYQILIGVIRVEQGWISSQEEEDFHEAVIVHFDPQKISIEILIEIHLYTHSSTSDHSLRKKYRSAVYVFDKAQKGLADKILEHLQNDFDTPIITRTYLYKAFQTSEESFQNYYRNNPNKPFCKSYIDPKLKLLMTQFSKYTEDTSKGKSIHEKKR